MQHSRQDYSSYSPCLEKWIRDGSIFNSADSIIISYLCRAIESVDDLLTGSTEVEVRSSALDFGGFGH